MSCPPVKQTAPVFALRMDAVKGAKAASIVCVRFAGLGGCVAGLAASDLPSSEAGNSGLHAAQGCSRRHGGRKAASTVYVRFAGLGGCVAGLAASVLPSGGAGDSDLRAAHGCSRRHEGRRAAGKVGVRLLTWIVVLLD